jgi:hypothetical protein
MKLNRLLFSFLLLAAGTARADNLTWTGAVNNEWNTTDANWSGDDTVYADGDDVLFDGTSGEVTNIVNRSPNSTTVDSDNKVSWNQIPIPESTAGNVTITPGASFSRVSVEIPVSGPNGFARLVVSE